MERSSRTRQPNRGAGRVIGQSRGIQALVYLSLRHSSACFAKVGDVDATNSRINPAQTSLMSSFSDVEPDADATYLVLTKPNVIMNDIRLRGLAVAGSEAAGRKRSSQPRPDRSQP
jgi:hypothetical protein